MRGIIHNAAREMAKEDVLSFLKKGKIAHVATVGEDGYPYVIPLVYIYEEGTKLYLHTGNLRESHFQQNIKENARVCIEICEMGDVHPGKRYACQSALVYTSVIAYGKISQIEEEVQKVWFFDRLWEKYGDPNWKFEQQGYPAIGKINLYVVELETVTGKQSAGLSH
ncbi:pyridoxamine 5'-phosphate oxidase family protein [Fodinisporobacter ferrooxydans]|uniref:Pyridoxamine 5'-phosphate oxidase family protein n=1 Tax=Fodinisporobacter ferrooxydans TaxID=2901836 RepID=A0ABY4CIJ0_9BACL|nr:pyridoxamine 5'-phosphate oxidase family protein [Alicyclobacillaceae bacterium MYW30-H2]